MPVPEWREIPDTDGRYFASDDGQIMGPGSRSSGPGALKPRLDRDGYATVNVYVSGRVRNRKVHRLVLEAFVGPGDGLHARHLDGDPSNNRLDNLAWGTASENNYDMVRHHTHHNGSKTHCPQGHEYTPENTCASPGWGRKCRECSRRRERVNPLIGAA